MIHPFTLGFHLFSQSIFSAPLKIVNFAQRFVHQIEKLLREFFFERETKKVFIFHLANGWRFYNNFSFSFWSIELNFRTVSSTTRGVVILTKLSRSYLFCIDLFQLSWSSIDFSLFDDNK